MQNLIFKKSKNNFKNIKFKNKISYIKRQINRNNKNKKNNENKNHQRTFTASNINKIKYVKLNKN